MPTRAHMRSSGSVAERTISNKNMNGGFNNFLVENREHIVAKIKRDSENQKVSKKYITNVAKELWNEMSEQQQMVYTI